MEVLAAFALVIAILRNLLGAFKDWRELNKDRSRNSKPKKENIDGA